MSDIEIITACSISVWQNWRS